MRSVFVSFYSAYPPVSGAASVTWNCARFTNGEVTLIQLGDESREECLEGVRVITLVGQGRGLGKLVAIRRLVGEIIARCQATSPDVIVLEGASWAIYHAMLLRAIRKAGLRAEVWYHSHNVERILRRSRNGRVIAALTGWAEDQLLRGADKAYAVSPVDQQHFRELYGVETALWPNGVDVATFDAVTPEQTKAIKLKYGFNHTLALFMGLYAYPPNTRAVEFLVQDVFPAVLKDRPDAKLVVIGGVIPLRRPWLMNPGIIPHEELPAFIKACDVGVAPLFDGSGTRLKILEYMAARLPVVATSKAAEGIDARNAAEIFIADDATSFATCVAEAVGGSARASQIAEAGYSMVCEKYDWRKIRCNRS